MEFCGINEYPRRRRRSLETPGSRGKCVPMHAPVACSPTGFAGQLLSRTLHASGVERVDRSEARQSRRLRQKLAAPSSLRRCGVELSPVVKTRVTSLSRGLQVRVLPVRKDRSSIGRAAEYFGRWFPGVVQQGPSPSASSGSGFRQQAPNAC
jgi:hypothetical protein